MTDDDPPLARCTFPGCPVRYRHGPARLCAEHRDDGPFAAYSAHKSPWRDASRSDPATPQPEVPK